MGTDHLKKGVDDLRERMIDQLAYIAVAALKEKAFHGLSLNDFDSMKEKIGDVLRGFVRP